MVKMWLESIDTGGENDDVVVMFINGDKVGVYLNSDLAMAAWLTLKRAFKRAGIKVVTE